MFNHCVHNIRGADLSTLTHSAGDSRIRFHSHALTQLSINLTHCAVNLIKNPLDYHAVTFGSQQIPVAKVFRNIQEIAEFTN